MFNGVGFVDEFYCEDRAGVAGRNCFLYSGVLSVLMYSEESETYDAYAPLPIVLDIIRNGKSRGKGSN